MQEHKHRIRKHILGQRNKLGERKHKEKSKLIKQRLFSSGAFKKAKTIAFFYGIKKEVHTESMIEESLKAGKRILLPRCVYDKNEMNFLEIKSLQDLEKRKFGLMEPKRRCKKVKLRDIEAIIVPAVAFDYEGHRLGYGQGYYDRLLKRKECKARTVGLCFELQLVKKLPREKHDVAVDKVITENRTINADLRRMNQFIAWLMAFYYWFLSQLEIDKSKTENRKSRKKR